MSTKRSITRRSTLAGLSTAAVGATAALAVDADAGLLALGAQFDALLPDLTSAQRAARNAAHTAELEIARRLGFPDDVERSHQSPDWYPTFVAVRGELRTNEMVDAATPLWARMDAIEIATRATPARTIAGMAVKARVVALHMDELWMKPEADLDYEMRVLRDLIENICAVAGVPLPSDAGEAQP